MPNINTRNFASLLQTQVAAIQGRCSQLIDFSVGSALRSVTESNSGLSLWLQAELLRVLAATRAATSVGADLDSFVADYGLARLGASTSLGQLTFARFSTSAQAVVTLNALVETLDGTQRFFVTLDASNPNYNAGLGGYIIGAGIASISVPVAAVVPGALGNVTAGTASVLVSSITYVDTVTNAAAFVSGSDSEADTALRVRFQRYIQSLSRATVAAILFAVTSLKVGIQATIMENVAADGVTVAPGFLTVTVDDGSGNPSAVILTNALAVAWAYRAGGVNLGVFAPVVINATVSMTIVTAQGYDHQILVGQVFTTLTGFLNTLPLGASLSYTKLAHII